MRTRAIVTALATAALLLTACTGGSDDVEVEPPDESVADGADGTAPAEAGIADLPATTIETPTLDGRTLTMTVPGDVVAAEPMSKGLQFFGDTTGVTITTTDVGPDEGPGGDPDAEPELVEERWDGEVRIFANPEGVPAALYDDGDHRLVLVGQDMAFQPITSTDELLEVFDRIDIERTDTGPVVTTTDPDLERGLFLTYDLLGIDSTLTITNAPELQLTPSSETEDTLDGAGGDVVVGEDGDIVLMTDELQATILLVLADEDEEQRGLELMSLLEIELTD